MQKLDLYLTIFYSSVSDIVIKKNTTPHPKATNEIARAQKPGVTFMKNMLRYKLSGHELCLATGLP
jgi:hypothetical protein